MKNNSFSFPWGCLWLALVVLFIGNIISAFDINDTIELTKSTAISDNDIYKPLVPAWLGGWNLCANFLALVAVFLCAFKIKPIFIFRNTLLNTVLMLFIIIPYVMTPFYECSFDSCTNGEFGTILFITFILVSLIVRAFSQLANVSADKN